VLGRTIGNTNTLNSPQPRLGGATIFPLIVYSVASHGAHIQMVFLSRESRVGVSSGSPEIVPIGTPATLEPHNLHTNLESRCNLKQSCSFCQELSNGMSHALYSHVNRVNSRLFLVGSQTGSLTPSPSFGHNLCFKCPNEQCEPILDI